MISFLNGTVVEKGANHLVVQVGGFGFEVRAPAGTIDRAPSAGSKASLFTYLHVREDALCLYGFDSPAARDLFVKLMSVSGFGAAKALGVLSVFSPEQFEGIVGREDADALTVIPGVGKKGAQRLVLEMKDKVGLPEELAGVPEGQRAPVAEAAEALVQLGYSRGEALDALRRFPVDAGEATVEDMLQFALKSMDSS